MRHALMVASALSLAGCATVNEGAPFLKIHLVEKKVRGSALPRASLPSTEIKTGPAEIEPEIANKVSSFVSDFNRDGDPLLSEVFAPLYGEKKIEIPVVLTAGVPEPYDAWTAVYAGEPTVFINQSVWDRDRIDRALLAVIKHEVSHVLMRPFLRAASSKPEDELNLIVVNEGIAHFIGYVRDRKEILKDKSQECDAAERGLLKALEELKSARSDKETNRILRDANTGPFWKKFGSITGMCRAARIYQKFGVSGLTTAIRNSAFPTSE